MNFNGGPPSSSWVVLLPDLHHDDILQKIPGTNNSNSNCTSNVAFAMPCVRFGKTTKKTSGPDRALLVQVGGSTSLSGEVPFVGPPLRVVLLSPPPVVVVVGVPSHPLPFWAMCCCPILFWCSAAFPPQVTLPSRPSFSTSNKRH